MANQGAGSSSEGHCYLALPWRIFEQPQRWEPKEWADQAAEQWEWVPKIYKSGLVKFHSSQSNQLQTENVTEEINSKENRKPVRKMLMAETATTARWKGSLTEAPGALTTHSLTFAHFTRPPRGISLLNFCVSLLSLQK